MLRFLVILLLLILIWQVLKALVRRSATIAREAFQEGARSKAAEGPSSTPVSLSRCSACGAHFPSPRALGSSPQGRVFCSPTCREAGLHAS